MSPNSLLMFYFKFYYKKLDRGHSGSFWISLKTRTMQSLGFTTGSFTMKTFMVYDDEDIFLIDLLNLEIPI